jgi:3'-5' exoribonuclease
MTPFQKLVSYVRQLPEHLKAVCFTVLSDPEFERAPASAGHHPGPHQQPGGLSLHTLEVAEHAIALAGVDEVLQHRAIVAAVFHDYGKVYEYAVKSGAVAKTAFYSRVGHIVYSWHFFLNVADGLTIEERDEIGHALLAHHGRKEWGSPVEPQTKLAFILHTADMLSARGIK